MTIALIYNFKISVAQNLCKMLRKSHINVSIRTKDEECVKKSVSGPAKFLQNSMASDVKQFSTGIWWAI